MHNFVTIAPGHTVRVDMLYSAWEPEDLATRVRGSVTVTTPEWEHVSIDLRSGVNAPLDRSTLDGLTSAALDFLAAAGESFPDGENADLFPAHVSEWAQQYSDELSLAAL